MRQEATNFQLMSITFGPSPLVGLPPLDGRPTASACQYILPCRALAANDAARHRLTITVGFFLCECWLDAFWPRIPSNVRITSLCWTNLFFPWLQSAWMMDGKMLLGFC